MTQPARAFARKASGPCGGKHHFVGPSISLLPNNPNDSPNCPECGWPKRRIPPAPAAIEPQPVVLVLPYPPSVNTYWRHLSKGPLAGRTLISEKGREYRKAVAEIMLVSRSRNAPEGNLAVTIEARMPDKRKRDLDNIPKAVLDALTVAKFWLDDSLIDDLRVWRSDKIGGEIVVTIAPFVRPGRLL